MFFQQKTEKISRVKKISSNEELEIPSLAPNKSKLLFAGSLGIIKSFFQDRYHLLFKGAAENHLRIQNALKNPDGTYQLTIKFDSYTDLKKYQKKLRRMTVSLSGALAMMIVAVIVAPYVMNPNKSAASNFTWIQNSWAGTAGATAANKSGWTGYASKDANINNAAAASGDHAANSLTLNLPAASTTGEANATDANHPTAFSSNLANNTGFYVDASGNLSLKKPNGVTCGSVAECSTAGAICASSVCAGVDGTACPANTNNSCIHSWCSAGVCTNSLVAGYHFNEASGTTAADFSGNNKVLNWGPSAASFFQDFSAINGWTGSTFPYNSGVAHSGSYAAWLNGGSGLVRSFTTGTSGTLTITFWDRPTAAGGYPTVTVDGTALAACTGGTANTWKYCAPAAVTISVGAHIVQFSGDGNLVDDVNIGSTVGMYNSIGQDTVNKKYPTTGGASAKFTTSYLSLSPNITLGAGDWTVSTWVRWNGASNGVLFADSGGTNTVTLDGAGSLYMNGVNNIGSSIASGSFIHIAIKKSGTSILYYINGTLNKTTTYTWPGSNVSYIGNNSAGTAPVGNLDDFLVFNRALSDSEITAIASQGVEFPW